MMKNSKFVLKMYSITCTLAIVWILFSGFNTKQTFDEITVERINVIEDDGTLRMVISNEERQHPGLMNGVTTFDRERSAGILFFSKTDEIGGLVYDGDVENGNSISLTTDKWKNDQVMQLAHTEFDKGSKSLYGLKIMERPSSPTLEERIQLYDSLLQVNASEDVIGKEMAQLYDGQIPFAHRLFIGKKPNDSGGLFLYDRESKPRINIYVDAENNPHMEVLDENGNTIKDLIND